MSIYNWLLGAWFWLAGIVFITLLFVNAPYGRYVRRGWGLSINNKLGWLIMESGAALLFFLFFVSGNTRGPVLWIFFLMWEAHYIHRAFVYPFSLKGPAKSIPVLNNNVVMMIQIIFFISFSFQITV